jgi:hypothetical protein
MRVLAFAFLLAFLTVADAAGQLAPIPMPLPFPKASSVFQ